MASVRSNMNRHFDWRMDRSTTATNLLRDKHNSSLVLTVRVRFHRCHRARAGHSNAPAVSLHGNALWNMTSHGDLLMKKDIFFIQTLTKSITPESPRLIQLCHLQYQCCRWLTGHYVKVLLRVPSSDLRLLSSRFLILDRSGFDVEKQGADCMLGVRVRVCVCSVFHLMLGGIYRRSEDFLLDMCAFIFCLILMKYLQQIKIYLLDMNMKTHLYPPWLID